MFSIILILCPQVHVLNLPIGYKTPSAGRDAAHLENCKWKVEEQKGRKWQYLVSPLYELENTNAKIYFQLMRVIPAVLLLSSIGFFISYIFQWMYIIQNQSANSWSNFDNGFRSLFVKMFFFLLQKAIFYMYQRKAKATLSIKHQMRQMSMSNLTRTRVHVLTYPGQPIGNPKPDVFLFHCRNRNRLD